MKEDNTKNLVEEITIVNVRKTNLANQACADIIIPSINGDDPFGYFIDLEIDTDSEIHTYIKEKIASKEVELLPPLVSQDDYDSVILKSNASQILSETDHLMTIDTELSEEEIKEMKEYRKALRNISKSNDTKGLSEKGLPEMPKFITCINGHHIIYTGSGTEEK